MGVFSAFGKINTVEEAGVYFDRLEKQSMQEEMGHMAQELSEVKEDLLKISDAFDNKGWESPLDQKNSREISLATVKKIASVSRAVTAINPQVKTGVNARIGYIFGKGVTFDGVESIEEKMEDNRNKLFSPQALEEFERVLATDGNSFTALPVDNAINTANFATAFRIPLDQIADAVSNPTDIEDIWYYRREYVVRKTNGETGAVEEKTVIKYYASLSYWQRLEKQNKALPRRWKDAGVEQNFVIQHVAVNKQVGWRWGIPDVTAVLFWANAYKEYLEDNAKLVKAYSRIAWQIKAGTTGGANAAAATVGTAPTRDPITGQPQAVGATMVTGLGGELTSVPNTGSSVDFTKGSPLAASIAAGLEVPLSVITSEGSTGTNVDGLDPTTRKAMELRQKLHTERFLQIFAFWGVAVSEKSRAASNKPQSIQEAADASKDKSDSSKQGPDFAVVTWPQIDSDTTKDRMTALGTAVELGILFKQEGRKEALDVFGIAPYKPWDELPTLEDDPAKQEQVELDAENADKAAQAAKETVIAKQGVAGGVSAKGGSQTSNNAARDARKKDSGK